jgi:hypothetical protein
VPVRGDGVELPVRWRDGRTVKHLEGRPVGVRFELADAELYGFRFRDGR